MRSPSSSARAVLGASKFQPWFMTKGWQLRKQAIAKRVARKAESAHERATVRKAYAKRHGLLPRQVTNAMIGFA